MKRLIGILAMLVCVAACGATDGGPSGGGVTCGAGQRVCSGVCTDVESSRANCGSCGNACGGNLVCSGGLCVLPSPGPCSPTNPTGACPSGQSCTGGACVTPTMPCSSANPTGPCSDGMTCVGGACCADDRACGSVCCNAGSVCFADASGNRSCARRCATSSECPASANCCATLTDGTGNFLDYGVCSPFIAGMTSCRCSTGTECSGGCTPRVGSDGIPRGPYTCTADGCGPYQHCTGLGSCGNGYCNMCDLQGRCYCAQVCTTSAMCGGAAGASCSTLARSNGSCSASQTVCVAR